jgi:acetylornithine deacetylase
MAYMGQNAVVKAAEIVRALDALQHQLDREHQHPLWRSAPVAHTFNVARIEGGRFAGVVPDECTITAVAGCIGGESIHGLKQRVSRMISEVAAADPWLRQHPPKITWGPMCFEPSVTDPDHPFVHTVSDAVKSVTGHAPEVNALPAGSDLRTFINIGSVPGTHFGPGVMHLGHGENEYVRLDDVVTAVKVVTRILLSWTTHLPQDHPQPLWPLQRPETLKGGLT